MKGRCYVTCWSGKDFNYRGYNIINDKKRKYLMVYDKRGNYVFREENWSHGNITVVKKRIDDLINRHGE